MYVVTVEFIVKEAFQDQFHTAIMEQAANSLQLERDCHHFDVAISESEACRFFLYELYTDKASFNRHLNSDHFIQFNNLITEWVTGKTVQSWNLQS